MIPDTVGVAALALAFIIGAYLAATLLIAGVRIAREKGYL